MPETSVKDKDVPSVETIFGKYYDKEIFLALNRARSKVVATGSTPKKAYRNAIKNGYKFAIIVKAPKSEIKGLIL